MKGVKNIKFVSYAIIFLILFSFLSFGTVNAAEWSVGPGKDYATIQEAIDNENTLDGDIILVYPGTYLEDVVVNKNLTIQTRGVGVELIPTTTGFTIVDGGAGTTLQGFKINSSPAGTGINISADNCVVDNNNILGGKTGIMLSNSNHTLLNNLISGQSENGVLGNLTGGFFSFQDNYLSSIMGNGVVTGISLTINGTLSYLDATGNIISNIESGDGSVFGIQIGKSHGADGNPELANINFLTVTGNLITGIKSYLGGAVTGIEIVTNSIEALIGENTITHLSGGEGSNLMGLEAAILGNGTVQVFKNQVSYLDGDEMAAGIVAVSFGDLILEHNQVSYLNNAQAVVGILGLGLKDYALLDHNLVTHLNSPGIAAGIVGTALNELFLLHNNVFHVQGTTTASLIGAGFNHTHIMGNNLEGDASGIGIVICSFDGNINYNRIVNFDSYIQNFLFSSFGPSIDEMLKPIDDAIKEHPEYAEILQPIRDELDDLFRKLENSDTTATYNWYGTSNPEADKFFKGNGTLIYDPWLILSITADPSTINNGGNSLITAHVYQDSKGVDHSPNYLSFFIGPSVTFTTNLGSVGSKSITLPWVNGRASTLLRASEGPGIATVTATDYESVSTIVTILGGDHKSSTLVGMQETGVPMVGLVLAILALIGGFAMKKRK